MKMSVRTAVVLAATAILSVVITNHGYSEDISFADNSSNSTPTTAVYYTFKTNADGSFAPDAQGNPQIVQLDAPPPSVAITVRKLAGTRVRVAAECRTKKQRGTDRRACDSVWSVFTAPEGYVLSKDSLRFDWGVRTGAKNDAHVEWTDYTDVIPGLQAPRTMKVYVHAISNGIGTRGHSKCTASAECVRIP